MMWSSGMFHLRTWCLVMCLRIVDPEVVVINVMTSGVTSFEVFSPGVMCFRNF